MKKKSFPLDLNGTGYCASFNFRRTAVQLDCIYILRYN